MSPERTAHRPTPTISAGQDLCHDASASHGLEHLLDGVSELGDGAGFGQTRRGTLLKEQPRLRIERVPGEKNDALEEVRILALQRPVETRPVEFWHPQVTHEQVIATLLELRQRQAAVGHRLHDVAITAQQRSQALGNAGFIVNDQNRFAVHGWLTVQPWGGGRCPRHGLDRQLNAEGGPLPCLTRDTDGTAVPLDNAAAQGQAQTRPKAQRFGGEEGFENAFLEPWWNARTGVRHLERDTRARRVASGGERQLPCYR